MITIKTLWEAMPRELQRKTSLHTLKQTVDSYKAAHGIKLPVKDVRNGHYTGQGEGWSCDVTFGIPDDGSHDDPTITVTSDDVEKYPQPGDVMLVYPPQIAGYASPENDQSLATAGAGLTETPQATPRRCQH